LSSGDAAYYDYVVTRTDGSSPYAKRAGTVIATWDGATSSYTDYSTVDLNSSTSLVGFAVIVSGTDIEFRSEITSGTWDFKLGVRLI
jgi:hypothetical protein